MDVCVGDENPPAPAPASPAGSASGTAFSAAVPPYSLPQEDQAQGSGDNADHPVDVGLDCGHWSPHWSPHSSSSQSLDVSDGDGARPLRHDASDRSPTVSILSRHPVGSFPSRPCVRPCFRPVVCHRRGVYAGLLFILCNLARLSCVRWGCHDGPGNVRGAGHCCRRNIRDRYRLHTPYVPRGNIVRLTASKMRSLPLSIGSAACHSRLAVLNTVPT